MAKDREYVFWWKMNISMPRLVSEWEELVEAFVSHLTHRYGKEEVKKWYFEIWNEPNHPAFFTEYEHIDEYFRLYDAAARAVKRVNSEYMVGGPATAGMKWIEEIIDHCREKEIPLDFISSHNYGVDGDYDGLTTREKTSELIQKSKPAVQSFALRSDCSGSVSFTVLQTENQADFITVSK